MADISEASWLLWIILVKKVSWKENNERKFDPRTLSVSYPWHKICESRESIIPLLIPLIRFTRNSRICLTLSFRNKSISCHKNSVTLIMSLLSVSVPPLNNILGTTIDRALDIEDLKCYPRLWIRHLHYICLLPSPVSTRYHSIAATICWTASRTYQDQGAFTFSSYSFLSFRMNSWGQRNNW